MVVEAYKKWHAVAVYFATGFGKSNAALQAVNTDHAHGNRSGLIVCHTEESRDVNWPHEIRKQFGKEFEAVWNVELCCYASLKRYAGKSYKWIILDEAHYLTAIGNAYLQQIKFEGIIILTATEPEDEEKKMLLDRLSKGHHMKIELDTAIHSKVLNDYRIRVWEVPLNPLEWTEYMRLSALVKHHVIQGNTFMVKKLGGERMRFIYNCETKIKAGLWLRDKIRETGKRFAIFAGSIAVVEKLTPYTMHSKKGDEDFRRFCNGDISEIGSIKQIQEGANIWRLESLLVQQLNSKQLKMIQTMGRAMRLEPHEIAYMHILVAANTVDINWKDNALKSFDKNKITHHKIKFEDIQNITINAI